MTHGANEARARTTFLACKTISVCGLCHSLRLLAQSETLWCGLWRNQSFQKIFQDVQFCCRQQRGLESLLTNFDPWNSGVRKRCQRWSNPSPMSSMFRVVAYPTLMRDGAWRKSVYPRYSTLSPTSGMFKVVSDQLCSLTKPCMKAVINDHGGINRQRTLS